MRTAFRKREPRGTSIPAAIRLPSNLYITGTINVDETTNPVSNKVLDRAVVIDMSQVGLAGFLEDLAKRSPELAAARAAAEPVLLASQELLVQHGLGFGYRVAEEVVRYHGFAASHLAMQPGRCHGRAYGAEGPGEAAGRGAGASIADGPAEDSGRHAEGAGALIAANGGP